MPPSNPDDYAARLALPFGVMGVRLWDGHLAGLDFLAPHTPMLEPRDALGRRVAAELAAYCRDPHHRFDLPLRAEGTPFRQRVWAALLDIPAGETRTYGDIARQLGSSPRAVGQALGDNPLPIVWPCHRVLGRSGLGGFNHHDGGFALDIKRWLLAHEGVRVEA